MIAALALSAALLRTDVTPATLDTTICQPGWTKTIRPSRALTQRYERDHLPLYADPRAFTVDHRIPLSLGGKSGEPNLQLQRKADAKRKDRVEGALHRSVCKRKIGLRAAQRVIWGYSAGFAP